MPQTLHRFGFIPEDPADQITTPKSLLSAIQIRIHWTSWCDLIYTTTNADNMSSITYGGTGLSVTQQHEFTSPSSTISHGLADTGCHLSFFGSTMHDGVRGYICDGKISVFGTLAEEAERGTRYRDIETWTTPSPPTEVRMCSDSSLLLAYKDHKGVGHISTAVDLQALKTTGPSTTSDLASFAPTQLVTNATTATALSPDGRVYTRTTDPRYPSCLGHSYTETLMFEPVPYLSETRISKIASGGYMTAAISEDGELFLWGQANPGTEGELGMLQRLECNADAVVERKTVVWCELGQDEDVKCLNIRIDGRDAIAYDVAVGFGHILVAAKEEAGEHVVFAAGCGAEGQLGLGRTDDFLQHFEEVVALRGKHAIQLAAAGWSSFVVTEV